MKINTESFSISLQSDTYVNMSSSEIDSVNSSTSNSISITPSNNDTKEILGDIFCSGLSDQSNGNSILIPFLVCGVLTLIINTFGVIGNTLSLCILTKSFSKVSILLYLIGLSVCDTTMLLVDIFCFVLPVIFKYYQTFKYYTDVFVPSVAPYAYPFADFGITGSTYFTVAITIDRYIVVCWPLEAKSSCTMKRARYSSILIILVSFVYNVPRFLEYTTVSTSSDGQSPPYQVKLTEFGANLQYKQWYLLFAWFIFLFIIPFIILFILNFLICQRVRNASLKRHTTLSAKPGLIHPDEERRVSAVNGNGQSLYRRTSSSSKQSLSITYMCVSLVIVFLVCNVPFFINRIVQEFLTLTPIPFVVYTSNILTSINASVNWIIYCLFGKKFREEFLKLVSSPCCLYCMLRTTCCFFTGKGTSATSQDQIENSSASGSAVSRGVAAASPNNANKMRARTGSNKSTMSSNSVTLPASTCNPKNLVFV